MTKLAVSLVCLCFAMLGAQPANAGANDRPNFGYDENGNGHADYQQYRREHAHAQGQARNNKHHKKNNGCQSGGTFIFFCANLPR